MKVEGLLSNTRRLHFHFFSVCRTRLHERKIWRTGSCFRLCVEKSGKGSKLVSSNQSDVSLFSEKSKNTDRRTNFTAVNRRTVGKDDIHDTYRGTVLRVHAYMCQQHEIIVNPNEIMRAFFSSFVFTSSVS